MLPRRSVLTLLFMALFSNGIALAQYPSRPVRIVVPFLPGAAPDLLARLVADGLSKKLGQPVVVENKSGANGNIGGEDIARSPADGHALLFAVQASIVISPHLYKLPYDPLKDFVAVASLASNQYLLAVNNDLPVRTLNEFVDLAKQSKQPLIYSSSGIGSQQHLAMEILMKRAGIPRMVHIPYKGASAAAAAMMAGEVVAGFSGSAVYEPVKAGRLRGIAMTGRARSETLPQIPTIAESYPGYQVEVWFGLMARTGTPDAIVSRLSEAVKDLLAQPDFVKRMQSSGSVDVLDLPRAEFAALIRADYEKYGRIISELGLTGSSEQ
ncbi:tripartite tricarboxylate transporter substrate binding protein [Roseiarcaceae bacterium H3SJ34-1]|uniref:Bug family tripartite tricarboxylate transporter substrate binding protein n=1 Tax=Terripilifer ovatus TaxID=3032367 RepID=UPI003AB959BD|nr:tripartite tricarboxylate transporter substrate binding protein [Roseiarcaceae bacterium H3SJ34-1]